MKQVEKILFPIDLASSFDTLVPYVKTWAEKFNATVYVLFVTQALSSYTTFVPHMNIENLQVEAVQAAKKKMAGTVQEFFNDIPRLETRVEVGSPAAKILDLADKEKIDLIIMGVHGRKGLDRAIFGSVADKVVQSAPCPVLTIRP